jgi:hypothetical protein
MLRKFVNYFLLFDLIIMILFCFIPIPIVLFSWRGILYNEYLFYEIPEIIYFYSILKCFIGIVSFILKPVNRNNIFSKILYLIPSLLGSLFYLYSFIYNISSKYYWTIKLSGNEFFMRNIVNNNEVLLLIIFGIPLWVNGLFHKIDYKWKKILFCIITPISILLSTCIILLRYT